MSFTATVTGSSPTGTVQFYVDGSAFGSAVTLASGSATSGSTSTLSVGTHTVTAAYSGDGAFNLASTGTLTGGQVVGQATAGTVVTSSGSPSLYQSSVTFTATINGEYGEVKGNKAKPQDVTGNVAWSANTGCGTTAVTSGNPGIATCTTTVLPTGSDTVTANYLGDTNHSPSNGSFVQTVTASPTTIAVTAVSPNNEDYGSTASVGITALLSWTGAGTPPTAADVSFGGIGFSGGSFSAASCGAPSGDTMTCTGTFTPSGNDAVGTYTFTAAFSGDSNYGASASGQTGNFAINGATSTTSVACSPNPKTYATSMTCTATINGENGNVKGTEKQQGQTARNHGNRGVEREYGLRHDQRNAGQSRNGDVQQLQRFEPAGGHRYDYGDLLGRQQPQRQRGFDERGRSRRNRDHDRRDRGEPSVGSLRLDGTGNDHGRVGVDGTRSSADGSRCIHWRQRIRWRLRNNDLRGSRA